MKHLLDDLELPVIPYDRKAGLNAGGMRKVTTGNGLSLGNRVCLMIAKQHQYTVLTVDKVWLEYQELLAIRHTESSIVSAQGSLSEQKVFGGVWDKS